MADYNASIILKTMSNQFSKSEKRALAIGQKWRTKGGQICTVMTVLDRQGDMQTFGVDSNSYAYLSDGKAYTNFSKGQHLEEDELIELIDQPVKETKRSTFEVRAEFPATEPPKFPEHWGTQARMDAIITRTRKFNNGDINPTDMAREISDLAFRDGVDAGIAYERERCIGVCQAMRPPGGRAWTSEQSACFEALSAAAEHIRGGVDPWAGRPERVRQKAMEALEEVIEFLRGGEPKRPEDLKETYEQIKAGIELSEQ